MVLRSLCKVAEVGETIDVLSGIRENIEALSRHDRRYPVSLRLDTFTEALETRRGYRGYCWLDEKIEATSRHSRLDQFIECRIKVIEARRGLTDPLSLVESHQCSICSPITYFL
jgi:hypothetical protein